MTNTGGFGQLFVVFQLIFMNCWCFVASNSSTKLPPCEELPKDTGPPPEPWLEQQVIGVFKVWHIIFSGLFSGLAIVIVLCCLFRCRIPRTKQEIEADFVRRKLTKVFRNHLNKIKIEELEAQPNNLVPVLQRVEKMEVTRMNKQVSFEGGKPTWRQKLMAMFAMEREMTGSSSLDDENTSAKYDENDGLTELEREAKRQRDDEHRVETEKKMKEVSKTVDNAKIDSSSFNVISDHFTILMGFESEKDRKKREKNERKQKQKEQKQREIKEKLERKEREKGERFDKKRKEIEDKLMKDKNEIIVNKTDPQSDDNIVKPKHEISIEVNGNVEDFDQNHIEVNEIETQKSEDMEPDVEVRDDIKPKDKKLKEKEEKKLREKERKEKEKEEKRLKEEKKIREREEKKELEERLKREKEEKKIRDKEEKLKAKEEKSRGKGEKSKTKVEMKSDVKEDNEEKGVELDINEEKGYFIESSVIESAEDVKSMEIVIQITDENETKLKDKEPKDREKKDKHRDRGGRSKDREEKVVKTELTDNQKKDKKENKDRGRNEKEVKHRSKDRGDKEKKHRSKDRVEKESKNKSKDEKGSENRKEISITVERLLESGVESEKPVKKDKSKERAEKLDKTKDKDRKSRERVDKRSKSKDRENDKKLVKQKRSEEYIGIEVETIDNYSGSDEPIDGRIDEQIIDIESTDKQSVFSTTTSTSGGTNASAKRMSREEKTKKLVDIQRSKSKESTRSDAKIETQEQFEEQKPIDDNNGLSDDYHNS